jgi:hypothetical protein
MLDKRIINTAVAGVTPSACTTDTVQILDGVPFESIATYQLDGNANDLTTNYNGTWGGTEAYATGQFGQAAVFNGSSSRITSGLTSGLTGDFSVSTWFTQDNISTDTAHRELISYMDANGSTGWWIGKHNNTSQWRILGVTGVSIVTMTAQAGWNHIAVVKDSSTVYVYLNGLQVTSFTFPGYWNLGSGNTPQFNIGTQYTGTAEYWDGSIDQVRIYNKALSADNVATLYNETVATASTNIALDAPSLVAYYKMSDATDETGSYDGTPSNVNFNVAGKFGNAGEFNGSSSGIDLPSLTNSYPFTVSAWINTSDFPSNTFSPIVQQNIAGQRITIGSTSLWNPNQIAIAFGGTSQFSTDANSITSNQWTHIVACFRASTDFDFYINGSAANVTNNGGNHGGTAANALGYNGLSTEWFNGSIDQVRIFDRAITSEEVETLYNEVQCVPDIVPASNFNTVIWSADGTSVHWIWW